MANRIIYIPDKSTLQKLNTMAINYGYRRFIEPSAFSRILEARYPVTQSLLYGDNEVRCRIILNDEGDTVYLDMDIAIFNALPEYDMADQLS